MEKRNEMLPYFEVWVCVGKGTSVEALAPLVEVGERYENKLPIFGYPKNEVTEVEDYGAYERGNLPNVNGGNNSVFFVRTMKNITTKEKVKELIPQVAVYHVHTEDRCGMDGTNYARVV